MKKFLIFLFLFPFSLFSQIPVTNINFNTSLGPVSISSDGVTDGGFYSAYSAPGATSDYGDFVFTDSNGSVFVSGFDYTFGPVSGDYFTPLTTFVFSMQSGVGVNSDQIQFIYMPFDAAAHASDLSANGGAVINVPSGYTIPSPSFAPASYTSLLGTALSVAGIIVSSIIAIVAGMCVWRKVSKFFKRSGS